MSNVFKRYSTAAVAAILAAAVLAGAFLFGGCKPKENDPTPTPGDGKTNDWRPNAIDVNVTSDSLYVAKVENLPDDFIMGMDSSCVPSLEAQINARIEKINISTAFTRKKWYICT